MRTAHINLRALQARKEVKGSYAQKECCEVNGGQSRGGSDTLSKPSPGSDNRVLIKKQWHARREWHASKDAGIITVWDVTSPLFGSSEVIAMRA